jgi:hypothetical protein
VQRVHRPVESQNVVERAEDECSEYTDQSRARMLLSEQRMSVASTQAAGAN